MREYGSEHHWQSRAPYETGQGGLEPEGWTFYRSGRDTMKQIAASHSGARVLLPALCCESMILPFEKNGCAVEFYRLKPDLTGDGEDVLQKLGPGCILLYMTYFDVRPFEDAFLERLKSLGVFLLEDRTQDIIIPRRESFRPDATVASLRKWAAMPEGGLLKTGLSLPEAEADSRFARLRRKAMEEKGEYLEKGIPEMKTDFLKKLHEADELLDESGRAVALSPENRAYILDLDFDKILERRRQNCAVLRKELEEAQEAGRLRFMGSGENTAGLYLGVMLENRDAVQKYMAERSIYCPVIWPIPEQAKGVCENCEHAAGHMLALPCDQRYGRENMKHIAAVLKAALEL